MSLLAVRNLVVRYEPKRGAAVDAVRDVSFDIGPGEFVGLIGESGSGKTTLGTALLRLLEKPGRISAGSVEFDGIDLTHLGEDELRQYRWRDISTVFQGSMNSLNPVTRIEEQFRDVIECHTHLRRSAVTERINQLFDMVLIDRRFINAFPHQLSGGMRQRVNLALAMALEPRFVLLDEPTTGLDVIVQHEILENVRRVQEEMGFAVLFISHDMGTVLDMSDRLMVMYAGKIVEEQSVRHLMQGGLHPYSKGLMGSYGDPKAETVKITYIPGRPPDLSRPVTGCPFAARCPERIDVCSEVAPVLRPVGNGVAACHVTALQHGIEPPELGGRVGPGDVGEVKRGFAGPQFVKSVNEIEEALQRQALLSVKGVSKTYVRHQGFRTHRTRAVRDVNLTLQRGSVTALVGQSGSGKSTLARMITGVESPDPDGGHIVFHHRQQGDQNVSRMRGRRLREYRRNVQMVFQDPYAALNPTKTIGHTLRQPLINYLGLRGQALQDKVFELLETVALTPARRFANRFSYELSGGQRQRVIVAKALAVEPELIVADEPISSLDVSIRAEILDLLNKLVQDTDIGILYITHDLLSARMLADEVVVLNEGRVVESGHALDVIQDPKDAYTKLLLDAVPNPFADPAA